MSGNAWDRYSDDIRSAMRLANQEACWNHRPTIEPLHLLVGMTKERTGLARYLLSYHGIRTKPLRLAVHARLPAYELQLGNLPMSGPLEASMCRAVDHAREQGYSSVGTGGMLLAMLRHAPEVGQVLGGLGVDTAKCEGQLEEGLRLLMAWKPGSAIQLKEGRWVDEPDEKGRSEAVR